MKVWQFAPRSSEQRCLLSVEQDLSCHAIAIEFAGGCGDGHIKSAYGSAAELTKENANSSLGAAGGLLGTQRVRRELHSTT